MRYWDASAIAPFIIEEPGTPIVQAWLSEDLTIASWALTRLEVASAIERLAREGRLSDVQRYAALGDLNEMAKTFAEVSDLAAVRLRALAVLGRYPLRAADAAQLGAALLMAEADPGSISFVSLDRRLADAARREGFSVLTWPEVP